LIAHEIHLPVRGIEEWSGEGLASRSTATWDGLWFEVERTPNFLRSKQGPRELQAAETACFFPRVLNFVLLRLSFAASSAAVVTNKRKLYAVTGDEAA
jgi:hypothetical protein